MTGQEISDRKRVRLLPPLPKDFDAFTATEEDLKRHGLPLRPDPQTQSDMAALWERKARRYRNFEHLEPQFEPATATRTPVTPQLRLWGLFFCHPSSRAATNSTVPPRSRSPPCSSPGRCQTCSSPLTRRSAPIPTCSAPSSLSARLEAASTSTSR